MSKGSKPGLTEYALTIGLVGIVAAMLLHPASWRLAAIMGPIDTILKQVGIADLTLAGTPQPANHTGPKWAEALTQSLLRRFSTAIQLCSTAGKPPLGAEKRHGRWFQQPRIERPSPR